MQLLHKLFNCHQLKQAATKDVDTGETVYSTKVRTSKLAFLGERRGRDSPGTVMRRLSVRVEDMTGLSTKSAERLQVVNYGIGGQYEPHHDFYYQHHPMSRGNRIATVLFYVCQYKKIYSNNVLLKYLSTRIDDHC